MCCAPLSTLKAHTHTHTGFTPRSSLHTYTHICMLQMLKETLPARTADDLHCKGQATRVKNISWGGNIPCGAVGKETDSWDDEQPSEPGWRREETLWDMK